MVMWADPRLLIVKTSSDVDRCETTLVEALAGMWRMPMEVFDLTTLDDLTRLSELEGPWSVVYVCGHGDGDVIGDADGPREFRWMDVSAALCEILAEDAWVFLACCRGGLDRVAYQLFAECGNLRYVFGPSWEATPKQLAVAFHVLIHNCVDEGREPTRAAHRASEAIDLTIRSFDREDVEWSDAYFRWHLRTYGGDPADVSSTAPAAVE